MKPSLLALLLLSLTASPAFAHGSHDDEAPPAQEKEMDKTAPAPAAEPAPAAQKAAPTVDPQAAPTPAASTKEP